jgi:hypothetical protein
LNIGIPALFRAEVVGHLDCTNPLQLPLLLA